MFERSLKDLEDSKIVTIVKQVSDLSFGANISDNMNFKLYPVDTGLILSQLICEGDDTIEDAYKKIRFGKLSSSNLGILYECLVCQTLVANGIKPSYHTFEYIRDGKVSKYEIDYTYYKKGKLNAVEVKSTNRFEAPSINVLNNKYPQLKINKTIISPKTINWDSVIIELPIYMSFLL